MKITPADQAFSKLIRARAKWRCEMCGTQYEEGSQGLHCSHFHGRANWSVRFDPNNCEAACMGCHMKCEGNPHEFTNRWMKKLGKGAYEILLERKNDISLAKLYRKTKGKGEIAKHFRDQLQAVIDGAEIEAYL